MLVYLVIILVVILAILLLALRLYTFHLLMRTVGVYDEKDKRRIIILSSISVLIMELAPIFGVVGSIIIHILIYYTLSSLYQIKRANRIVLSTIFVILGIVLELLSLNIYFALSDTTADIIATDAAPLSVSLLTSSFIPYIIIKIYAIKKKDTQEYKSTITLPLFIQLISIPFISIVIIILAYFITVDHDLQHISIISMVCIVIINLIFLSIYGKFNSIASDKIENEVLSNQIEYYLSLYEKLNLERKETMVLKHNIRNDAIKVKTLLTENKSNEALEELETILNINHEEVQKVSDIPIIDAIVNYKIQSANKNSITVEHKILLDKDMQFNYSDITNILGNALDNAIEACTLNKCKNNKTVKVRMHQNQNNIYINISNPYEQAIVFKDSLPLSNKRDNKHGIGLRTINKIVKDKNNIININTENNIFNLEIILFSNN